MKNIPKTVLNPITFKVQNKKVKWYLKPFKGAKNGR